MQDFRSIDPRTTTGHQPKNTNSNNRSENPAVYNVLADQHDVQYKEIREERERKKETEKRDNNQEKLFMHAGCGREGF
jgi:hypothetical protein